MRWFCALCVCYSPGGCEVTSEYGQMIIWSKHKRGLRHSFTSCEKIWTVPYIYKFPLAVGPESWRRIPPCTLDLTPSGTANQGVDTPLMCCTLIWHSHLACKNINSRRQACRNGSLALPVWMTTTELRLSHHMVTFFPERNLPQTFRATVSVSISSPLICMPSSWMKAGNAVWKYWPWNHPPAPERQASHANIASGSDQSTSGMTETPL